MRHETLACALAILGADILAIEKEADGLQYGLLKVGAK
jgi:hypothetical protein